MTGDGAVTDGVVAVVTGAARGIGEAVARALTGAGARVAALDVDTERVERVAAGLGTAIAYPCQVADGAAVDDVIARVETDLGPIGLLVNVVSPGSTDTPMQRALWTGEHGARAVVDGSPATFRVGIPLGRLAAPEDIADAVLFLASDRARHITMQDLYVDGGATLRS